MGEAPDREPLEYPHMRTRLVERAREGDDAAFGELVDLSTMRLLPGGPASPAPSATPRPS